MAVIAARWGRSGHCRGRSHLRRSWFLGRCSVPGRRRSFGRLSPSMIRYVPNTLTVFRLLSLPVFVWLYGMQAPRLCLEGRPVHVVRHLVGCGRRLHRAQVQRRVRVRPHARSRSSIGLLPHGLRRLHLVRHHALVGGGAGAGPRRLPRPLHADRLRRRQGEAEGHAYRQGRQLHPLLGRSASS